MIVICIWHVNPSRSWSFIPCLDQSHKSYASNTLSLGCIDFRNSGACHDTRMTRVSSEMVYRPLTRDNDYVIAADKFLH